jgi:hypothetical protein
MSKISTNGDQPAPLRPASDTSRGSKLQRSIFVAGFLKVLESLVRCSGAHTITLFHVEPRRIASVDRSNNLNFRFGVRFVPGSQFEPLQEAAFVTGVV